jgi:DNA polymerase-3 subunit alpha
MPDIDIDFDDVRRDDVVNYLVTKYGQDKVAHIITFQRMKSKMAIRDVGRILGIDLAIITKISKLFTMEYEDDIALGIEKEKEIKDYYKQFPRLFDIASRIVTFPRQIGLHAAGIVVSESALGSIVPVQLTSDGSLVTQYSMEYIEPLGLIKMDLLSLSNLSTIKEIISLIKKDKNIDLNIYDLSIDDEGVFNQLAKGDTVGIFQLESQGMKNTIMKIKPKTVEDISITLALFRPGPMENIPTYLANKAKPESIVYMNELFKKVLAPTYNVIVYQEQLMEIVRGVANYSYAQADIFRRIISKKKIEELNKLEIEFKEAAASNGYSQEQADEIYKYIYAFANYGFNHSHSLAYSYITY